MSRGLKRSHEAALEAGALAAKLMELTENAAYYEEMATLTRKDIEDIEQAACELVTWCIEVGQSAKEVRVSR